MLRRGRPRLTVVTALLIPLLYGAAMNALRQWKFEPTYLYGEAVAIKWNVSVKFRIESLNSVS